MENGPSASQLMEDLNKLDLDGELPAELQGYDSSSEESKKKVGQAFGGLRSTLKTAKEFITTREEQFKETEKKLEEALNVQPAAPQGGGVTPDMAAATVMNRLQIQAMQNTGLTDVNNPLLGMEVQRLYNEEASAIQARGAATQRSGAVIEETLAGFKQFKPEDLAEVKQRLSILDVLDQVNPEVIQREAHQYMGENFQKFSSTPAAGDTGAGNTGGVTGGVSAGAAAASSAMSGQGGGGVEPGAGAGTGTPAEVKPADPNEVKRMKVVGADPTNLQAVQTFRNAEKKKASRTS